MTADQLFDLADGDRLRFNRRSRLAAWIVAILPHFIAAGVAHGISAAFGGDAPTLPTWDELLKDMPDYLEDEE